MGYGLSIGSLTIFLLVGLISQALVIRVIVKPPQGGSLSFLRAVSISGFQTLAGLIFMFLLGFILNILNIKA
ncbi:MAG: hypothetical protein NZ826_00575 [Thermodesulfovibrio sp.]|nr:hypothetical protein [Thermodesulfovibrio sp.]